MSALSCYPDDYAFSLRRCACGRVTHPADGGCLCEELAAETEDDFLEHAPESDDEPEECPCNSCRHADLPLDTGPCAECRWLTDSANHWEPATEPRPATGGAR